MSYAFDRKVTVLKKIDKDGKPTKMTDSELSDVIHVELNKFVDNVFTILRDSNTSEYQLQQLVTQLCRANYSGYGGFTVRQDYIERITLDDISHWQIGVEQID